jgi:hypothetical protein
MTVRIRNDERAAIVAALESDDYDSPETAAKAIFELVAGLLAKRSGYALVVEWGPGVLYGPYFDQREAKSAGKKAAATFASEAPEGSVRVIPLGAPVRLSESLTAPAGGTSGCVCGHAWGGHMNQRWKQWKKGVKDWSKQPWQAPGCMACECKVHEADRKSA